MTKTEHQILTVNNRSIKILSTSNDDHNFYIYVNGVRTGRALHWRVLSRLVNDATLEYRNTTINGLHSSQFVNVDFEINRYMKALDLSWAQAREYYRHVKHSHSLNGLARVLSMIKLNY